MKSELLVASRGGEFEYLVTVGTKSENSVAVYGYVSPDVGAISPTDLIASGASGATGEILAFGQASMPQFNAAVLSAAGEVRNYRFHIGRNDTKQYLGAITPNDGFGDFVIFTAEDVGKTLPFYIGITPPPYA